MSDLLELANAANEAVIAYREAAERGSVTYPKRFLAAAAGMAAAVDRLTGAVVEAANDAPIVLRREDLTRIAEIEDVAFENGQSVPEAIIQLVNERLSGGYHDGFDNGFDNGYNAALDDLPSVIKKLRR